MREINYGVAGGKPQEWLDSRYTPAPDDNRLDHDCGIVGAETRRDVAKQVFHFIDEVVGRPCQAQIIVTHGLRQDDFFHNRAVISIGDVTHFSGV